MVIWRELRIDTRTDTGRELRRKLGMDLNKVLGVVERQTTRNRASETKPDSALI